jgi:uroporphyrinogen decarboxylase
MPGSPIRIFSYERFWTGLLEVTSRERIITALEGGKPDRVPVMEMAIDWKVMKGLQFSNYFSMIEGLDLDAVAVNQVLYLLGLRRWTAKMVKTYTDEWGVKRQFTGELLPFPVEHPVHTAKDLAAYKPPNPADSPLLKAVHLSKKRCPDRAVVMLSRAVFAASWYLVGLENILVSYITDPGFAKEVARLTADYHKRLCVLAVEAGVDVIILTDDYAHKTGCLMSPQQFKEFVLPGFAEVVAAVKQAGGYCIKHTDGNIWEILDPLVSTGIDGLGPLEPAAGMDLAKVRARIGPEKCLVGNIDVDLLSRGSTADVAGKTRELIETISVDGAHILSSGNTITSSVSPGNFRTMIETAREMGV